MNKKASVGAIKASGVSQRLVSINTYCDESSYVAAALSVSARLEHEDGDSVASHFDA